MVSGCSLAIACEGNGIMPAILNIQLSPDIESTAMAYGCFRILILNSQAWKGLCTLLASCGIQYVYIIIYLSIYIYTYQIVALPRNQSLGFILGNPWPRDLVIPKRERAVQYIDTTNHVHIKIAGLKWIFIHPTQNGIFIGIDPYRTHMYIYI